MSNPGSISFIKVHPGETLEQAYRKTSWTRPMPKDENEYTPNEHTTSLPVSVWRELTTSVLQAVGESENKLLDEIPMIPAQSRPTATDTLLAVREQTHGDYTTMARIAQNIKQMMMDSDNWAILSSTQTQTLEMIAVKIARILAGDPDFHDHWADIAGYAKLQADRSKVP